MNEFTRLYIPAQGVDLFHLLEQTALLLVTATRVDDDDLIFLFPELSNAILCDTDRIRLSVTTVERNAQLRRILLQLVEGPGTECICTNLQGRENGEQRKESTHL